MDLNWEVIFNFLGAAGVGATTALGAFRYFGKSWLDSKFAERLASFKHKQEIEIQRMRIEIDSTLSGVLRIQEKEFETLTETWSKLEEAFSWVANLVTPIQMYADLNRMTVDELQEFFEQTELTKTQIQKIKTSKDKLKIYIDEIYWHRLNKVDSYLSNYNICVARYGIFFTDEMHEKFTAIGKQLRAAVADHSAAIEDKDHKARGEAWKKFQENTTPLLREIEANIRGRLRSYGPLGD